MELKVGDEIICHKACVMSDGTVTTTIGKHYTIIKIEDYLFIIHDDQEKRHWFPEDDKFFSIKKIQRLKKLKKLSNGIK